MENANYSNPCVLLQGLPSSSSALLNIKKERSMFMSIYNTPYDDVFRTLLTDCKWLIVPVVNEIFDEQYNDIKDIVLLQNEIYIKQQDGVEEKKITDSSFAIILADGSTARYHLECQSSSDGSMILRMFEYDSQIALMDRCTKEHELTVNFPNSAVLYLRHNKNTPDVYKITINTPGGKISYLVPTLKVKEYSIDDIFAKRLFFLIPFYIFGFEVKFDEISQDEEKLESLRNKYAKIVAQLNAMTTDGIIDAYTNKTICEMSKKVVEHLASKYDNIIKGVSEIMGGKILDYEAKDILNQGRNEGAINMLISLVRDGLLAIEDAAKKAGMTLEDFSNTMNKR